MIYGSAEEQLQDQQVLEEETSKLAVVTSLFTSGCAKIRFYGDDVESEKEYSYVASYKPTVGDTVLLSKLGDTWIIIGKILFKEVEEEEVEVVKNYLELNNSGNISIGSTGSYNYLYDLYVGGKLNHKGSSLGFFSVSPVSKGTVASLPNTSNATLVDVAKKVNEIIGDKAIWIVLV